MSSPTASSGGDERPALDPAIAYPAPPRAASAPPRAAFLTGATGFLGAHLLSALLSETELAIDCLVRTPGTAQGQGQAHAHAALVRTQAIYGLSSGLEQAVRDGRVHVTIGDLAQPRFGLDEAAFERLGASVDVIYHSGAQVSTFAPYRVLAPANVGGTQEVLRLAACGPATRLHHLSSLAIEGPASGDVRPPLPETLRVDTPAPQGGYARSKWAAERLVCDAADRGLRATIYRPGRITAHSETGACALRDGLSLLIGASLRLGIAPLFEAVIHLTPVDSAARAIVEISRNPAASGGAFHLLSPIAIGWNDIVPLLQEMGCSRTAPYDEWRGALAQLLPAAPAEPWLARVRAIADQAEPPFSRRKRPAVTSHAAAFAPALIYPTDARAMMARCAVYLEGAFAGESD